MVYKKDSLKDYKEKRDFTKTTEPASNKIIRLKHPIYVIQKHNASHLHYDFRLEIDGVLKSWAIPKGPSYDPKIKRLAVETEDHPLSYATFEGVIPEGEYGGGTVMVWDLGTFKNLKNSSLSGDYNKGKLEIWLEGEKLKGGFVLIKTKLQGKSQWLFKKMDDEYADVAKDPVKTKAKSVLSGRTTLQITKQAKKD